MTYSQDFTLAAELMEQAAEQRLEIPPELMRIVSTLRCTRNAASIGKQKLSNIPRSVKAYFSAHMSLAAIGTKIRKLKLLEPIVQEVRIVQKIVKYSPREKLLDAFMAILAGAKGIVESSILVLESGIEYPANQSLDLTWVHIHQTQYVEYQKFRISEFLEQGYAYFNYAR